MSNSSVTLDCTVLYRANCDNCPQSLASSHHQQQDEPAPVTGHFTLQQPLDITVDTFWKNLNATCGVDLLRCLYLLVASSNLDSQNSSPPQQWVCVRNPCATLYAMLGEGFLHVQILAFEKTLKAAPGEEESSASVEEEDEESTRKGLNALTIDIRDQVECRRWDNHPGPLARAVSRSLVPTAVPPAAAVRAASRRAKSETKWPAWLRPLRAAKTAVPAAPATNKMYPYNPEVVLGQRLDGLDHRGNWYPGSVVEIYDDDDEDEFRVHFDNFAPKWDEVYSMEAFQQERLAPLHSKALHATTASSRRILMVCHSVRNDEGYSILFGQPFPIELYSEWSLARAGAHLIAQASRCLRTPPPVKPGQGSVASILLRKAHIDANQAIDKTVRILLGADYDYTGSILSAAEPDNNKYPALTATMTAEKQKRRLLLAGENLPFEIYTVQWNEWNTSRNEISLRSSSSLEECASISTKHRYPLVVERNVGNNLHARFMFVLEWKRCRLAKSLDDAVPPTLYHSPFKSLGSTRVASSKGNASKNPPSHLVCPITCEVMKDPVITKIGISFEREAILQWIRRGNSTCPVTRKPIGEENDIYPNRALKEAIETYWHSHAIA